MDTETLYIGAVAARAGVNIQTIRYYERRRLLGAPTRRPSGYRVYAPDAVRRVRFIKGAQGLGFSLDEVSELLRLRDDQKARCAEVRVAAQAKIADIARKLGQLRKMRGALAVLVQSCTTEGSTRLCPILEALDEAESPTRRAASVSVSGNRKKRSTR